MSLGWRWAFNNSMFVSHGRQLEATCFRNELVLTLLRLYCLNIFSLEEMISLKIFGETDVLACEIFASGFRPWHKNVACLTSLLKWAISELLFVLVSKWVLVLNYCTENEFDVNKNTPFISIWMVVHQDSLWNWGMQQLGNGLLVCM